MAAFLCLSDLSYNCMEDFINQAFEQAMPHLPQKQMILAGATLAVVANGSTYYKRGSLGGYEPEQVQQVSAATVDLPAGKEDLTGQQVTVDGAPWRIAKVNIGSTITHLDLISTDED